jgi:hypothetical protein
MEVVEFLNTLYTVMDKRMDDHDVYKGTIFLAPQDSE